MTTPWISRFAAGIAAGVLAHAGAIAADSPEGPIGTTQQPLVGEQVDEKTQEEFGLLHLSSPDGDCSASMLNDYWAITAAHCVFSNSGRQYEPKEITLSSMWPGRHKSAQAVKIVPFSTASPWEPHDIALVQAGRHDFGRPDHRERKLFVQAPRPGLAVNAFGAGISQLAGGDQPSQSDGLFRNAQFEINEVTTSANGAPDIYAFPASNGSYVAAGDSGGPSFIRVWDDPASPQPKLEWQLIGVHSKAQGLVCIDGKSCGKDTDADPWAWVKEVKNSWDASIYSLRQTILDTIRDIPPDGGYIGTFPSVPPEVVARKRALYAMSLDEPLIAPPDAAIDVQLTFKRCHDTIRATGGCPVAPEVEQWSYNPDTHQLLHVQSGKCLNISGARWDAGAPIILYPCVNAPNEKWTVVAPGGTSEWTIKSDLTGQCLHAMPGSRGSSSGVLMQLPRPATLVQMYCDGSTAQRFRDVDAGWYSRNGPR